MCLLEVENVTKHSLLLYTVHHAPLHHKIVSVVGAPY